MKNISTLFIFFLFILIIKPSYSEDALTIKQQLDRIIEEVSDLNKAVFNKSFDKKLISDEVENKAEKFTSIDIRIYDLENDIKALTLQFEEILFKLDDLSNSMISLEDEFIAKFEKLIVNEETLNIKNNNKQNSEILPIKEENTLGKLIISDNSEISSSADLANLTKVNPEEEEQENNELQNLSPEDLLQFALDQMIKKNYEYSKKILDNFIEDYSENPLSGSAHFWLGKIYLFETDYRKAAIVFGEGVQKFPKSIKAAEMYYELAKSLKEMDKNNEACKTLNLLEKNYKGNKFTNDPEKIKDKLSCKAEN